MRTLLFTAALAASLFPALPAFARSKFQGWVEQGGLQARNQGVFAMRRGALAVTNPSVQQSYPNATVLVCVAGYDCNSDATKKATIYADAAGTALGNPLTAASTGYWSFYGDSSSYDIRFSGGGITTPYTLTDVTASSSVSPSTYLASSYGMLCDGTTDTLAAWTALIAAAKVTGGEIVLPAGVCSTSAKWTIPADSLPLTLRGSGKHNYTLTAAGTIIKASASMTAVIEILSPYHTLSNIAVNANRLATYGIFGQGWASTTLSWVYVNGATLDGVHSSVSSNNNSVVLDQVWSEENGELYATSGIAGDYTALLDAAQRNTVTGTAATTAGSATITITGSSTDFSTIGIRSGDWIRVEGAGSVMATAIASAYVGIVLSATASTITTQPIYKPLTTVSGAEFAIGVGNGLQLTRQADNNIWHVRKGLYRGNAGVGINSQSLYGSQFDSIQADNNAFFGFASGLADGSALTISSALISPYFEGNVAGLMWFHQVDDVSIVSPNIQGTMPIIRPAEDTAGRARGVMLYDGRIYKLQSGWEQNFVVQITNNAGTLQHRIVSDTTNATAPAYLDDTVSGATTTYNNTPSVTSGVDFTAGVGIDNGATNRLLLNTGVESNGQSGADHWDVSAVMSENSTGTDLLVSVLRLSHNVNGVTRARVVLRYTDSSGNAFALTTANIASGKTIAVRVRGYIKR